MFSNQKQSVLWDTNNEVWKSWGKQWKQDPDKKGKNSFRKTQLFRFQSRKKCDNFYVEGGGNKRSNWFKLINQLVFLRWQAHLYTVGSWVFLIECFAKKSLLNFIINKESSVKYFIIFPIKIDIDRERRWQSRERISVIWWSSWTISGFPR